MHDHLKDIDMKEIQLPQTTFIRDIENRVFQGIVVQALSKVEGIGFIEAGFLDNILGNKPDSVKGIFVEQDHKKHSVLIRVELNICYEISIPDKAEEIQTLLVEVVSRWTGLHVASVHVVFRGLMDLREEKEGEAKGGASEVVDDAT
jgi:uncharacterized alkaline shock family protein YloU